MNNVDRARKFYSLPRITAEDRVELLSMLHTDVRYNGVNKETAQGRDAVERLFKKYEHSGRGITSLTFDIRHIAGADNFVLVDMVDTFVINDKPFSAVFSIVFEFDDAGLITFWQEHYDVSGMDRMYDDGIAVTEGQPEFSSAAATA